MKMKDNQYRKLAQPENDEKQLLQISTFKYFPLIADFHAGQAGWGCLVTSAHTRETCLKLLMVQWVALITI